jgi:hypothetical protein
MILWCRSKRIEERNVQIIFSASQFEPRSKQSKQARMVFKKGQNDEILMLKKFSWGPNVIFRGMTRTIWRSFDKKKFN